MLTREQALDLLHSRMESPNLRRHCYAVEIVMKALATRLSGDPETWGIAGLLHDADYEITKTDTQKHTHLLLEWLTDKEERAEVLNAISAHAYGYVTDAPEPKNHMEWALYCCDELTGFIVAIALVRPEKKLSAVTVDAVISKWNQKAFAKGVDRDQIALCEEKLGIPLPEFVQIALTSMQSIAPELGL